MRGWVGMVALTLPLAANAAGNITDNPQLRICGTDADCVLIQGVCHETAVNIAFKDEAAAYYREQAKGADCPNRFWEAKEKIAQCTPKIGDPNHTSSACDAVAKPAKKK